VGDAGDAWASVAYFSRGYLLNEAMLITRCEMLPIVESRCRVLCTLGGMTLKYLQNLILNAGRNNVVDNVEKSPSSRRRTPPVIGVDKDEDPCRRTDNAV
jgi:hypothetical protein